SLRCTSNSTASGSVVDTASTASRIVVTCATTSYPSAARRWDMARERVAADCATTTRNMNLPQRVSVVLITRRAGIASHACAHESIDVGSYPLSFQRLACPLKEVV